MKSLNEIIISSYDFIIDEAFIQFDESIDLLHTITDRSEKMSIFENVYNIYDFIRIYTKKRNNLLKKGV